jgi:hypothetical protein
MAFQALFTPTDDCQQAIIDGLNNASSQVQAVLAIYMDGAIHTALLNAMGNTGNVIAIFDRRMQFLEAPRLDALKAAGVEVLLDKHERAIKSQYLNIDDLYVYAGSYLYTYPYDLKYASSLIITDDVDIRLAFSSDFMLHYSHADPY